MFSLCVGAGMGLGATVFAGSAHAATNSALAADSEEESEEFEAVVKDPRKRTPPRRHRFRLAFQLDYVRLSAAIDDDGNTQRFHYLPLQLDFGYQLQFLRYMMIRPSLAIGANPANTLEGMPAVVQPQLFGGYQGRAFGVAFGYGWLFPFPARTNVISDTRGGLGQPIITNNHAVRGELSYTTRVDRGALSFALRLGGLKSHIQHYELDETGWRFMLGLNIAWFFGDGHKSEERRRERERSRNRRAGARDQKRR